MISKSQVSTLEAISLCKKYSRKEVVRGVDLEAKSGEVVGLLGPNGAGKTTTFSMIAGFLRPTSGTINLNEIDLSKLPAIKELEKTCLFTPESSVFRKLTVEDNIRAIAETLSLSKKEQSELIEKRLLS